MPTAKRFSSTGLYPHGRHSLSVADCARRPYGYNYLRWDKLLASLFPSPKGTPGGITNGGGIELAGEGAGRIGTNFTALFAQGTNLKYTDAGGNQVSFGVKGGGYLQDLLTGSGVGQRLVLVGEVPHRTIVSGSVKQGKHGTGRAYLGYSFYGLGQFGNVRVTLKSPPFQIQRYPFSPGLPLGPPTALARVSSAGVVAAARRQFAGRG